MEKVIKTFLMSFLVGLIAMELFGCGTLRVVEELRSNPDADLIGAIQKVTITDLKAAYDMAVADNDLAAQMCYPVLASYVMKGTAARQEIVGAFSAFQKARSLRRGIGAGVPEDLKLACAALLSDEHSFLARLSVIAGSKGLVR